MCFSPEGDLVGGIVVAAIGVDACRHLHGQPAYRAIAALPLVLGLHQIDETFVWWGLQGHVNAGVGRAAMWIYLIFALVVLPTVVPLILIFCEPTKRRRLVMLPFLTVGLFVSTILLVTMARHSPQATLGSYHISYSIGLHHGIAVIGLYIVATCGPLFTSGFRHVMWFGVANVVAVAVLARLCAEGFTSLWCFYAALVSGGIALHLRYAQTRHHLPALATSTGAD